MLDEAFDALKQYDWGTDRAPLAPIEEAVTATHGNAAGRQDLENRLLAALKSDISRDAKDYVCRKLTIVGSAAAVPVLAPLLADKNHAHMARFALERIQAPEAGQALRESLPKLTGNLKIGAIGSIGARRDTAAVPVLTGQLGDSDATVARAAAIALGDIGTAEAAQALQQAVANKSGSSAVEVKQALIDGQLACAETLLANHQEPAARAIYQSLSGDHHARLVRVAATRGMLACASKKA